MSSRIFWSALSIRLRSLISAAFCFGAKGKEAESQYRNALSAFAEAGRRNSAYAAAIEGQLACLYRQEHRNREAAVVRTCEDQWLAAETDFRPPARQWI
jgi:hypothetical protein